MRKLVGILAFLAVLAGACGSDGGDDAPTIDERAEDLLLQRLVAGEGGAFFGEMNSSEGSCFAHVVISDDALLEVLLSDDENSLDKMSPDVEQSLIDALLECAPGLVATRLAEGLTRTASESNCLGEKLLADHETLRALFASLVAGDEEPPMTVQLVFSAMQEACDIETTIWGD